MKHISPVVYFPCYVNEEWRYITDRSIEGIIPYRYLVSNYGRIYSMYDKRLLTIQINKANGYLCCHFRKMDGSDIHGPYIHRIEMIEFCYRPDYNELQVNHIDGNKTNNRLDNLEWCTQSENIRHAFRTGLMKRRYGEEASDSKITNEQADRIGYLLSQKYTIKEVSDMMNVSEYIVHNICYGNTWKNIYNRYNLSSRKHRGT